MTLTCFIRYESDPFKRELFRDDCRDGATLRAAGYSDATAA